MIFQIRLQSFSNMTLIWGGYQVQCNSKLQKDDIYPAILHSSRSDKNDWRYRTT
jgi:hypothetical protein